MNHNNNNLPLESSKAIVTNQASKKNNGIAINSLVFGIISMAFCWTFIIPFITGLLSIILGIISLVKKRDGSILAIIGIFLSIIGIILNIIFILLYTLA